MAFTDFLFNGSPPPSTTTLSTNNTQFPDWWQAYTSGLLSKTNAVVDQGYTPYQGPRVADFTPDQNAAFQGIRDSQGIEQPFNNAAAGALTQASDPSLNPDVFNSYMSPYTDDVVNHIADLGARNLGEKLLPQVNDTFTKAGQFGSSRNADFTNRAVRDTNEAVLAAQAGALETGFSNAESNYGQGQYRSLMAGQQLGALGQTAQSEALKGSAALDASGQEQQQNQQKSLDTAYQDFTNQRDWDKNQLTFMNSMIRGINPPTSSSTSTLAPTTNYSASPLAQVAGVGLGAASLGKVLAAGGRVRFQRGGGVSPRVGRAQPRARLMSGGRPYRDGGPLTVSAGVPSYG